MIIEKLTEGYFMMYFIYPFRSAYTWWSDTVTAAGFTEGERPAGGAVNNGLLHEVQNEELNRHNVRHTEWYRLEYHAHVVSLSIILEVKREFIFSSAVPPGSGAFQMPTRPSAAAAAPSASTLRGGRANLRNASVTFSLFLHEASLGWH